MKPRVWSDICYTLVRRGVTVERENPRRVWIVEFDDCGREEEWFDHFKTALCYANHVAGDGSRWEFVS